MERLGTPLELEHQHLNGELHGDFQKSHSAGPRVKYKEGFHRGYTHRRSLVGAGCYQLPI